MPFINEKLFNKIILLLILLSDKINKGTISISLSIYTLNSTNHLIPNIFTNIFIFYIFEIIILIRVDTHTSNCINW